MKDLQHIRGRHYIAQLVSQGEHSRQDFKYLISDARKIARSISAFANAEGGRLLIGVKDNGTIAGVRNEEDIFVVEQAAQRYCDPPQQVDFTAFSVEPGIVVIRASIAPAAERPVRVLESDGSLRAYFRVADENIAAHPLMVRVWRTMQHRALTLTLDQSASTLIALANNTPDGLTVDEIAIALHSSRRTAQNLIVRLASAAILDFTHTRSGWRITSKHD